MRTKSYTFFIASSHSGDVRKLSIPHYVVHVLVLLALVGGATVVAAVGSYSRMLWKVTNYNDLRRNEANLRSKYSELQTQVRDTNQRLSSLQSLATEVAMTYGLTRFRQTPFGLSDTQEESQSEDSFEHTVEKFDYLRNNASAIALSSQGLRLLPGPKLGDASFVPSIWPVAGQITCAFGERLDPFNGEGAFHTGVDIGAQYGEPVHAVADGVITAMDLRGGYGRLVVIDHGFGISTWYGHLSGFSTHVGMRVKRGDVIGYVGASGRATAPHVHYEVRIYDAPVNPWRYLQSGSSAD